MEARDGALRLFLYGTLMAGSDTPMARWVSARMRRARPATVAGRLLAVPTRHGWYPALIPDSSGARARGLLCDATFGAADLARLDRYEGDEYVRLSVPVIARGMRSEAQAYVWKAPVRSGLRPIPGGDFLAWLASGGGAAYAGEARDRAARKAILTVPR